VAHDRGRERKNYINHDIGLIGRGGSVEDCFVSVARVMFSLMVDIDNIHQMQIVSFEFEGADLELALLTWLNLLLEKSREHGMMFGDFRLKREGTIWKATVAGEPWRQHKEGGMEVKAIALALLSVKKIDHSWEARCIVGV